VVVGFGVSLYELVVGGADALEGPDSKTMMSATTSLSYPSGTAAPTPPDQAPGPLVLPVVTPVVLPMVLPAMVLPKVFPWPSRLPTVLPTVLPKPSSVRCTHRSYAPGSAILECSNVQAPRVAAVVINAVGSSQRTCAEMVMGSSDAMMSSLFRSGP